MTLLELIGAYAPFANGGQSATPHVVERIRTLEGNKTLYKRPQELFGQVVDTRAVGMMNAMMQETLLSGTARKAEIPGWSAAGKTGTSQDFRDAWFVGYTANLVTGVWLGNDDNSPTKKATGGGLPVEVWTRFMRTAHQGVAVAGLPSGGGFFSNFSTAQSGQPQQAPQPVPAAARTAQAQPSQRPVAEGGMDGWLMDRLLGRR